MPKFYAVKKGVRPGVYLSWSDCQNQTKGFSGAVFKSFSTRQEAEAFIAPLQSPENNDEKYDYDAYTDGSYMNGISGGACVIVQAHRAYFSANQKDGGYSNNRGELLGIILALQNTTGSLLIHTDSQYSINILSNGYTSRENLDMISEALELMKNRKVHFVYVPAHTGDHYNEIADTYAKKACSHGIMSSERINP